jgi:hypothetical protein
VIADLADMMTAECKCIRNKQRNQNTLFFIHVGDYIEGNNKKKKQYGKKLSEIDGASEETMNRVLPNTFHRGKIKSISITPPIVLYHVAPLLGND